MSIVLLRFVSDVMKHHDQDSLGRKGLLGSLFKITGHYPRKTRNKPIGKELMQNLWRDATYCLACSDLRSLLYYTTQDHQHRDGTTHNNFDTSSTNHN